MPCTVHVVPIADLIEHDAPTADHGKTSGWLSVTELPGEDWPDCPCGCTVEPCPTDDGGMGWLLTHHSLDGRELSEAS